MQRDFALSTQTKQMLHGTWERLSVGRPLYRFEVPWLQMMPDATDVSMNSVSVKTKTYEGRKPKNVLFINSVGYCGMLRIMMARGRGGSAEPRSWRRR